MPQTPAGAPYPDGTAQLRRTPTFIQQLAEWASPKDTAMAFLSGWGNYESAYQPCQWTDEPGGWLRMSGMFRRTGTAIAATTAAQVIATFPLNRYPRSTSWLGFTGGFDGSTYRQVRVDVAKNGTTGLYELRVQWTAAGPWSTSSWVSLDGLCVPVKYTP